MKIFVSKFVLEANENIPVFSDLQDIDVCYGENCVVRMQLKIPEEDGIEIIPGIYADVASSGVMKKMHLNIPKNINSLRNLLEP